MTMALKRTIIVLLVLVGLGIVMLVSLVTAHHERTAYAANDESTSLPKMVVSDVAYKAPVGIGITSKKATAETIAELEKATTEAEVASELEAEAIAKMADFESYEADWQAEEADYAYGEVAYYDPCDAGNGNGDVVGQGWYDEIASSYGITSYVDGSGYYDANVDGAWYEGAEFVSDGRYKDGSGMGFTWYPESVLPGGGLDIPGRHVGDEGYICDENGNVCLASDYLPEGTVVNIPFGGGTGVVYDSGCGYDGLDVYVSW